MVNDIGLGVKVFKRTDDLRRLLESVPATIETVYVADDGDTSSRETVYQQTYDFDVEVIDLPYDAGVGSGRKAVVDAATEEYILVVDPDHTVPGNVATLREPLAADSALGGVAGLLAEPSTNQLRFEGQDFRESDGNLIRDPHLEQKEFEIVGDNPIVRFDFVANAALFRSECLDDYVWDEAYVIGNEHVDFFVGHWHRTDWEFGVCPTVVFEHHPGGDPDYLSHRHSEKKKNNSEEYFLNKWGYNEDIVKGWNWDTMENEQPHIAKRAARIWREEGTVELLKETISKFS